MTIADKLNRLSEAKNAIKSAIESKGVAVGQAPFAEYADKIQAIPTPTNENTYTRPADWLPIPEIDENEDVVYLLVMISSSSTLVSLNVMTCDGGQYTVDLGDGTAPQNKASGQQTSNYITLASLADAPTTSLGYKQALVKVTAAGGIRELYIAASSTTTSSNYLQVVANAPNCVKISTYSHSATVGFRHWYIEDFQLLRHSLTSMASICSGMKSLKNVNLGDTSKVTDFSEAFKGCSALTHLPELDTGAATTLRHFCFECSSLRYVPAMDTGRVTDWDYAFYLCHCLVKLPPLNFVSATTLSNAIHCCYSLRDFEFHNTPVDLALKDTKPEKSDLINNVFKNLGNVSSKRLTLPTTVLASNLTSEEKAFATSKGWTLA